MTPQQQTTPTLPLWEKLIAFLMMFAMCSGLDFMRHLVGQIDAQAGNPIVQTIWLFLYSVAGCFVIRNSRIASYMMKHNSSLMVILVITILSTAWSIWPEATFRRAISAWGTLLMGAYFAIRFSPRQLIFLIFSAELLCAILSLFLVIGMPEIGVMSGFNEGKWNGIYRQKNILGRHMSLGVLVGVIAFTLAKMRSLKIIIFVAVLFQLFILFMSQSATSLLSLIVILVGWWGFSKWARLNTLAPTMAVSFGVAGVFIFVLAVAVGPVLIESVLLSFGKTPDLTGRTLIWYGVIKAIFERPLLGYGYDVFWDPINGLGFSYSGVLLNWDAPHAHNGLLELALNTGLIGVILFAGNFISYVKRSIMLFMNPTETGQSIFFIVAMLFVALNITEVTILKDNTIFWTIYIYSAFRSSLGIYLRGKCCNEKTNEV
jgi:exopolysaccharide production protein ExoQ